jgi:hypothetical protein
VRVAVLQLEAEHKRSEECSLDSFLPGRRGFIVKRLAALGRERADAGKRALTSGCLPCSRSCWVNLRPRPWQRRPKAMPPIGLSV